MVSITFREANDPFCSSDFWILAPVFSLRPLRLRGEFFDLRPMLTTLTRDLDFEIDNTPDPLSRSERPPCGRGDSSTTMFLSALSAFSAVNWFFFAANSFFAPFASSR